MSQYTIAHLLETHDEFSDSKLAAEHKKVMAAYRINYAQARSEIERLLAELLVETFNAPRATTKD